MAAILVVDDDPSIRALFAHALLSRGPVDEAANGAHALRMLALRKYDIVLLDVHMPIVDGFMVLQMLVTKPGLNAGTPVIVITADTTDHARVRALQRNAVYFLNKPVAIATLVALVDSTLKRATPPKPGSGP